MPPRPTARMPAAPIVATIPLLTLPMRTMATTSIVAASVTRRPRTNLGSMPIFASHELISGPPPCTSTGFRPSARSSATSRMVRSGDSTMAAPPYLMTTTLPFSRAKPGSDSASARARSSRLRGGSSGSLSPELELANLISSPCTAATDTGRRRPFRRCRRAAAREATAAGARSPHASAATEGAPAVGPALGRAKAAAETSGRTSQTNGTATAARAATEGGSANNISKTQDGRAEEANGRSHAEEAPQT
mmetsp:Transcript_48484/g.123010  ORF Transcript_48484/g.123010 Transcript_48484/m.123010 type:complete len:249 (+) Transcript_48484:549-1295(+)